MIKLLQKGVTMLVSAISANQNEIAGKVTSPYVSVNARGADNAGDAVFNSLTSNAKRTSQDNKLPQLYDSINEWKFFCHKQIVKGNLDIIA